MKEKRMLYSILTLALLGRQVSFIGFSPDMPPDQTPQQPGRVRTQQSSAVSTLDAPSESIPPRCPETPGRNLPPQT